MKTYKIEEAARQSGLTKRTIRYYEEIGLLFPPLRSEGGFRLYTDQHIERLKQIINARDVLGISLQELQAFIEINEEFAHQRQAYHQIRNKEDKLLKIAEIEQTIDKQLGIIDQKIEKLTAIRKDLLELSDKVQRAKRTIQQE